MGVVVGMLCGRTVVPVGCSQSRDCIVARAMLKKIVRCLGIVVEISWIDWDVRAVPILILNGAASELDS